MNVHVAGVFHDGNSKPFKLDPAEIYPHQTNIQLAKRLVQFTSFTTLLAINFESPELAKALTDEQTTVSVDIHRIQRADAWVAAYLGQFERCANLLRKYPDQGMVDRLQEAANALRRKQHSDFMTELAGKLTGLGK